MTIRCETIRKSFGGTLALNGISMRFPESGIIAVVGPNGAGKTTLLNIMTGFAQPDSGSCSIADRNLAGLRPFEVAQLSVVRTFQDVRLLRESSLSENVMCARSRQAGENIFRALLGFGVADEEYRNRAETQRILTFVGLQHLSEKLSQQLSYGQQKLLTVACAIATEASILLLDEPVSGVDPIFKEEILNLITRLRDDHRLVVFIEHDMDAVRQVADSVFVMDRGSILATGIPSEVLARADVLEAYLGGGG